MKTTVFVVSVTIPPCIGLILLRAFVVFRKFEPSKDFDNFSVCFYCVQYKKSGTTCITLLDNADSQAEETADTERWSSYVERYIGMSPTDAGPGAQKLYEKVLAVLRQKPVFLSR